MTPVEGRGTSVEAVVTAPPERLWPLVTDIALPARFSAEFRGARWIDPRPALGARFEGTNANAFMGEWTTVSTVERYDEPSCFGWAVGRPAAASWWYDVEPRGGGSLLRLSVRFGPGRSGLTAAIAQNPERAEAIVGWRLADLRSSMQATVDGIAALAEREPRAG